MFRYIAILESAVWKRYTTNLFIYLPTNFAIILWIISDHIIYCLLHIFSYIPLTQRHESITASVAAAVVVVERAKGTGIHTGNKFGANGKIEI